MTSPVAQSAPAEPLRGIDVSHYQGQIEWSDVAASGASFVFCKLTEGVDWSDPYGPRNLHQARLAGLRVGAYHYLTGSDPTEQAEAFLGALAEDVAPESRLPPVLDLESPRLGDDAGERAMAWLRAVEGALSVTPILYTYPSFAAERKLWRWPDLARFPIWIAHYGVSKPILPRPWSEWAIWQHSEKGKVPGIMGNVDLNFAWRLPG